MALTQQVKSELSTTSDMKPSARRVEAATMLRFAGGIHIVAGQIVVEAEFDTGAAARRLRSTVGDVFGLDSEMLVINASGIKRSTRYVVRFVKDGAALARQSGLIDAAGRPVRGLPSAVVSASRSEQIAVWRGAFLARGSLTEPGKSTSLEITCPSAEAAMALVGSARRLDVSAKQREVRGIDRVVVRDGDAIMSLLTRMGAHASVLLWEEHRIRRDVTSSVNRLANFDDANMRRSARAAVAAGARVQRALEILADDVPEHLRAAGVLRVANQQASLEELGQLHVPPLTKDAIAGRIRRLLAMADKAAEDQGIPNTEANLPTDFLDNEDD
ncbi:MAG: DNA-binding protein WhiA [Propionibacteriaceae bacterium]|jgi:DNA-binding protein WhiA|nr:DNA-binding protein WhiA [Propionibacteriaceae bacterium]